MTETVVAWIDGSEEVTGSSRGSIIRIRGRTVGMPAVLRVQLISSQHTVQDELARLLRSYWRYGPLGRVRWVDPQVVDDLLFYRIVLETNNPRRSTIMAAASDLGDSVYLVVRLLVAGLGRVEPHLEDVYAGSIRKAVELVEGAGTEERDKSRKLEQEK